MSTYQTHKTYVFLEATSGIATREEKKLIREFQKYDAADYAHYVSAQNTKKAKRCLETLLENYPGFESNAFGKRLVDVAKGYNNSLQREYLKKINQNLKEDTKYDVR